MGIERMILLSSEYRLDRDTVARLHFTHMRSYATLVGLESVFPDSFVKEARRLIVIPEGSANKPYGT